MEHTLEHNHEWGDGHHSLKSFLPLLAVPVAIGMLRHMARRHMGMHAHGRENWENGVPPFFAEWHRRAHEASQQPPAAAEVKES